MPDSIQLIDALMDNNKTFEFVLYPNQRHGFGGVKRENSNRRYIDFWFKYFLNR
jgi:dipeptidyl-peptidase-4